MGRICDWLRSCFITFFIGCFSNVNDSSTVPSNSSTEPTSSNEIPSGTDVVQEIEILDNAPSSGGDGEIFMLRSFSTRSSPVESRNIGGDRVMELFRRSGLNPDEASAESIPPQIARPPSSPASTLFFDEDDEDMKFSVVSDYEYDESETRNRTQECDSNDCEEEIDMENVFVTVDSERKLEEFGDVETMKRREVICDRPQSLNSDPSVCESRPRISVDVAVKYFDELGQEYGIGRGILVNVGDHGRVHAQKCSPRIASAAQKFGDMADHMM